jgi:ABC-type nitrate/sulfonate/bicarbonate transport system permease component
VSTPETRPTGEAVRAPERVSAPSRTIRPRAGRIEERRLSGRERLLRFFAPRVRLYQFLLLIALLGTWEYVGRQSEDFTFAPPSSVIPAAREMIASGELGNAATASLTALLLGFALAAVVGIGIGYAMGWWQIVGRTLDPYVAAMFVVPIASLVPLIIVWMGLGLASKVLVIFLFAIFEIVLSAAAGVRNVDRAMIDIARSFGAGQRALLWKVALPASLPFVFVALRIGAARALKGMVLAEMLIAVTGLGGLIIEYASRFQMDRVLVVIVTIVLMGVALQGAVVVAERWVMRWRH